MNSRPFICNMWAKRWYQIWVQPRGGLYPTGRRWSTLSGNRTADNCHPSSLVLFTSPLGTLANRPMFFACVIFFSFYPFLMIASRTIISEFTGPIFSIITQNKSFLGADDRSGPLFLISQGTLSWQPILWKIINFPHSLFWHSETEWGIATLVSVRIDNVNDASLSCKNFVNFHPETLELTELICERLVRHGMLQHRSRPKNTAASVNGHNNYTRWSHDPLSLMTMTVSHILVLIIWAFCLLLGLKLHWSWFFDAVKSPL